MRRMELGGKRVLVCNCEGTMPLDGRALAKACGARGGEAPATQLCRAEIGRFRDALASRGPVVVACPQAAPLFDEQPPAPGPAAPAPHAHIRHPPGRRPPVRPAPP